MTQHLPDSDLGGLARAMTGHIIRISLVILLGIVTSAAIVVVIVVQPHGTVPPGSRTTPDGGGIWAITRRESLGSVTVYHEVWFGFSRYIEQMPFDEAAVPWMRSPILDPSSHDYFRVFRDQRVGWPMAACILEFGHVDREARSYLARHDDLPWTGCRLLSFGLLANTAIYGSAWALLLFAPGMFIRWRRRCAGRCAKCGYDLRGLSSTAEVRDQKSEVSQSGGGGVCPECGAKR